jgi:hypothetical protein
MNITNIILLHRSFWYKTAITNFSFYNHLSPCAIMLNTGKCIKLQSESAFNSLVSQTPLDAIFMTQKQNN